MATFVTAPKVSPQQEKELSPEDVFSQVTPDDIAKAEMKVHGKVTQRPTFQPKVKTTETDIPEDQDTFGKHVVKGLAEYPQASAEFLARGALQGFGRIPAEVSDKIVKGLSHFLTPQTKALKKVAGVEKVPEAHDFRTRTAEYLGGALPDIMAGGAKTISKLVTSGLTRAEAEIIVKQAAKDLTKNAGVATAGAMGAAEAAEMSDSPAAGIIGSILGGGAASFLGPRIAGAKWFAKQAAEGKVVSGVKDIIKPYVEDKVVSEMAKEAAAYPGTMSGIKAATNIESQVPGLKFRPAAKANVPSALEKEAIMATKDPKARAEMITQQNRNAEALADYVKQKGKTDLTAAVEEINSKQQAKVAAELKAAEEVKAKVTASLRPTVSDKKKVGERLAEIRTEEKVKYTQVAEKLYQNANSVAAVEGAQYEMKEVLPALKALEAEPSFKLEPVKGISDVRALLTPAETKPPQMGAMSKGIIKHTAKKEWATKPIPYKDLDAAARQLKADIRAESGSAHPQRQMRLKALHDALDIVENSIHSDKYPMTKQARIAADTWYREKYVPRFRTGLNWKSAFVGTDNVSRVLDEKKLGLYAKSQEGMKQFLDLYGNHPEATEMMRGHFDETFRSKVLNASNPEKAFENWMRGNKAILDDFSTRTPGIAMVDRYKNFTSTLQKLGEEKLQTMKEQKAWNATALGKALQTNNPKVVVDKALSDPMTMRGLVEKLDPENRQVLFRNITQNVDMKDATALRSFLDNNRESLRIAAKAAFGDKEGIAHIDRLRRVAAAKEILERTHVPETVQAIDKTSMKDKTGISWSTAVAFYRAHATGRIGMEHAALVLGGQAAKHQIDEIAHQIQQDMLDDPNLSKKLTPLIEKVAKGEKVSEQSFIKALGKFGFYYLGGTYIAPNLQVLTMPTVQQYERTKRNEDSDN